MKETAVLVVICGVFIAFGALSAAALVRDTRAGLASQEWPSVQGEVLVARRRVGRRSTKRFEYRYVIDGTAYTSSRAAFVRVPYIDPIYRKYRAGMAVRVFYDPHDPERSVVETGAPAFGVLAESLVSIVMFALGGAGLYFGLRRHDG